MPVGLLTLEIHLPYSHSLKEKRAVLRKIRDRVRARFNVAVAEMDHQDWRLLPRKFHRSSSARQRKSRSTLGIASVSNSQPLLESVFQQILAESEKILGDDVVDHTMEFFE